jgi:hypothetical protein
MEDPPNVGLFRNCKIGARVIPCHRPTTTFECSDQPQAHRLGPLLTVGHVDGDALSFRQAHDPGTVQRRGVHEDVLAAPIGADEAKPFGGVVALYGAKFLDRGSIDRRMCKPFRTIADS